MKITKDILFNYGKFLFRSGEVAYRTKKSISLDCEISDYIRDSFKDFLEKEKKIQEIENIKQEDIENETYN